MPTNVETAFDVFYDAINLGGEHRETANARRDRIVSILGKTFTIVDSFSAGSIPKYTALKNHADLDVMVVLHYAKHIKDKTPVQVLQSVRDALSEYKTGARKNGQAVTLYYDSWPNVDIVPVYYTENSDGSVARYNVPDANSGAWIPSNPKTFAATIESKSSECGANFRRIIKMAKHWNRVHSEYLESYHMEVIALKAFSGNLDNITWHVLKFFEAAKGLILSPLFYDAGYVDNYLSASARAEASNRLNAAYNQALSAWHQTYGTNNDHKTAIYKWRVLFGDKFPTYD